jgi:hypothetical protein
MFTYKPDYINGKGLLSLHSPDHIEIRVQPEELKNQLPFILETLRLPEKKALRRIDGKIDALLHKADVVNRILNYNYRYLEKWRGRLLPAQQEALAHVSRRLVANLKSDDPALRMAAIRQLKYTPPGSREYEALQSTLLAAIEPKLSYTPQERELADRAWQILIEQKDWSPKVWKLLPGPQQPFDPGIWDRLCYRLLEEGWPPEQEERVLRFLGDPRSGLRLYLLRPERVSFPFLERLLEAHQEHSQARSFLINIAMKKFTGEPWTEEHQKALAFFLKEIPAERLPKLLDKMAQNPRWPRAVYPELLRILKNPPLDAEDYQARLALLRNGSFPRSFVEEALRIPGFPPPFAAVLRGKKPAPSGCASSFAAIGGARP